MAVLPYGRPGVISGSMLGLGRALGETIAVTLILSKSGVGAPFTFSIFNGGETFASKIAEQRCRVQQPHADRSVHRGRPGAVRAHVRGQRRRPRRRHPAQGVRMSADIARRPAPGPPAAAQRQEQPCHRPGHAVLRARADPAGVAALDGAQQGLARDHPQRLVHPEPTRDHLSRRGRRRLARDPRHLPSRCCCARSSRFRSR